MRRSDDWSKHHSTSFLSMRVIVYSTWWGPNLPKHVVENDLMYNVLKVVFAQAINKDIDKQTQWDEDIKTSLDIFRETIRMEYLKKIFRKISSRRGTTWEIRNYINGNTTSYTAVILAYIIHFYQKNHSKHISARCGYNKDPRKW
jgi:hypothetical protein